MGTSCCISHCHVQRSTAVNHACSDKTSTLSLWPRHYREFHRNIYICLGTCDQTPGTVVTRRSEALSWATIGRTGLRALTLKVGRPRKHHVMLHCYRVSLPVLDNPRDKVTSGHCNYKGLIFELSMLPQRFILALN